MEPPVQGSPTRHVRIDLGGIIGLHLRNLQSFLRLPSLRNVDVRRDAKEGFKSPLSKISGRVLSYIGCSPSKGRRNCETVVDFPSPLYQFVTSLLPVVVVLLTSNDMKPYRSKNSTSLMPASLLDICDYVIESVAFIDGGPFESLSPAITF
jgi:hypothetical protein